MLSPKCGVLSMFYHILAQDDGKSPKSRFQGMCMLQSQQFKVTIIYQGSCVNNLSTQWLVINNNIISWKEATHFTYITFTLTFAFHGNEVSKITLVCLKQDIKVQNHLGTLITFTVPRAHN
jgi:hypothetical protein